MIKKDVKKFKDGSTKTHYRVMEGYRDSLGNTKMRTIKTFGYIEDVKDQTKFLEEINWFEKEFKKSKKTITTNIGKKFDEITSNEPYNYGYKFLESIYDALELESFFQNIDTKVTYEINEILKFLVIQRIINPDSKRATYQEIDKLYNKSFSFDLHHIYRALTIFNNYSDQIQKHISTMIEKLIGRKTDYVYYDTTNCFFEIDYQDEEGLRKRGVSKEHRVDPIVQIGMFLDENKIPLCVSTFPGNTSDSKTLLPLLDNMKKNYNLKRIVVVADKGINCNENIKNIIKNNDGYLFSQIIKGKKGKRFHEELFKDDYITISPSFKYKTYIEEYEIINDNKKETHKRKVLLFWNEAEEKRSKMKREEKVNNAKKALLNNAYSIKHGYDEYITDILYSSQTGEIADSKKSQIDEEKIKLDEEFDGYGCLITSELTYDYQEILNAYKGLWTIEESFKIFKSDLEIRPIYVSTDEHIKGHILTCFIALIIVRLLQNKLEATTFSIERIVRALSTSQCLYDPIKDEIMVLKNETRKKYMIRKNKKGEIKETLELDGIDETLKDFITILKIFNVEKPNAIYKKESFDEFLRTIKY